MTKSRGVVIAFGVLAVGLVVGFRPAVWSGVNCGKLIVNGFRPIAEDRAHRFQGKVKDYTAICRGGDRPLATASTPWVDWSNYWGAADESSTAPFRSLLPDHLNPDTRGVDGALLDLEYQRIELIKFNLFENNTFEDYVRGGYDRGTRVEGRAVKVWNAMRLPPDHPSYAAVGGSGAQVCRGELVRARTLTGICNDVFNPLIGSTNQVFARNVQFDETFPEQGRTELTRNRHAGRISLLQPDPQVISRVLFTRQQTNPAACNAGEGLPGESAQSNCDYIKAPFFNVLAAFWIQFMTHDWFSHLEEGHNQPALMDTGCKSKLDGGQYRALTPQEIAALGCRPDDKVDPAYVAQNEPAPTFVANGTTYAARAPKTMKNTNTAWWDASQIYGYDEVSAQRVKRDPKDPAKLLMVHAGNRNTAGERQGYLPVFQPGDPINPAWAGQEAVAFPDNFSIGMSFYHNVFVREHNIFVDKFRQLAAKNPNDDSGLRDPADPDRVIRYKDVKPEELYQAARLVVAAEIAKIHTIEWTTQLLYDEPLYKGMNANWFGLIRKEDALKRILGNVAVDKYGHSITDTDATQWYSVFASGAGIFGLGNKHYEENAGILGFFKQGKDIWSVKDPNDLNRGVNHFGSPFNFPEEFITVYRLHALVPDLVEFRELNQPNAIEKKVPVIETFRSKSTAAMENGGIANWAVSMGRQRLGVLTLQNDPAFLQNVPMPRLNTKTNTIDVTALDIIRDRERGIPRFNEFRRQYGLRSLTGFDDFVNQHLDKSDPERKREDAYVGKLREVYGTHKCDASKVITAAQVDENDQPINDCLGHPNGSVVDNVEDVDVVVGFLAESTRPHGFAISETQFTVFILNASRRLFSDRFFTSSFRPEFYSTLGVDWVSNNGPDGKIMEKGQPNGHEDEVSPLKRILLRTMPELQAELDPVVNVFDPWARDRGTYYSLDWKPRPGAESDPAFRK
jgi:hypothetical protein